MGELNTGEEKTPFYFVFGFHGKIIEKKGVTDMFMLPKFFHFHIYRKVCMGAPGTREERHTKQKIAFYHFSNGFINTLNGNIEI